MIQTLLHQLQTNQFLSGGVVMGAAAAIFAQCREWPAQIVKFLHRRFYIEVDIPDRDEAFRWLTAWLAKQSYSQVKARRLTVSTHRAEVSLSPAPGAHWFFHAGSIVHLLRDRKDQISTGSGEHKGGFRETFTLRIYGFGRKRLVELLRQAASAYAPDIYDRVRVYCWHWSEWELLNSVPGRNLATVVLPGDLKRQVTAAIESFIAGQPKYRALGVPWRFGMLFAGPPGEGKSTLVNAIAFTYNVPIYILPTQGVSDQEFQRAVAMLPSNGIALMEDVDCLFDKRKKKTGDNDEVRLSFSGVLNALDGVVSGEGRLLVMTTNHPEKLDPALVRPGRVDLRVDFVAPTFAQKEEAYRRFFPNEDAGDVEDFAELLECGSMAQVQQRLLELSR